MVRLFIFAASVTEDPGQAELLMQPPPNEIGLIGRANQQSALKPHNVFRSNAVFDLVNEGWWAIACFFLSNELAIFH